MKNAFKCPLFSLERKTTAYVVLFLAGDIALLRACFKLLFVLRFSEKGRKSFTLFLNKIEFVFDRIFK